MVEEKEEKKKVGYVVVAESIEAIRNENAELFKEAFLAIHDYNMEGSIDVSSLSVGARILFNSFKKAMDTNSRRYEERCKRNQENGKKSKGRKKVEPK